MGDIILKPGGGGADSDELTANKDDVLKGTTAVTHDSDGDPIAGTLELTGNAANGNVEVGRTFYNSNAKSKQTGSLRNVTNDGSIAHSSDNPTPVVVGDAAFTSINSDGVARAQIRFGQDRGVIETGTLLGISQKSMADAGSLTAAKLLKGQSAFGLSGTATGDANAAAAHILNGKTAYVNGSKVTGTMANRTAGTKGTGLGWNASGLYYYIPNGFYPMEGSVNPWVYMSRADISTFITSVVSFSVAQYSNLTMIASWAKPSKGPWSGVRIMCKQGSYPSTVIDGTLFYDGSGTNGNKTLSSGTWNFRGWNYITTNTGERIYNPSNPISVSCSNVAVKGQQTFTSSGTFTVPSLVRSIDIFLVGGGGGRQTNESNYTGAAGGGYTSTYKNIAVTPGQIISVIIGPGGNTGDGGNTSVGNYSVNGGHGNPGKWSNEYNYRVGQSGGSGGGGSSLAESEANGGGGQGGSDGSRGGDGIDDYGGVSFGGGDGQGRTTRAFEESGNTLYAGGGGGYGITSTYWSKAALGGAGGGGDALPVSWGGNGGNGVPNTGGGACGASYHGSEGNPKYKSGGSGIAIVRWGY